MTTTESLEAASRDVLTRGLAAIGLLGIALVHILDAIPTFSEVAYEGWLYIALIVCSVTLAGCLVRGPSRAVWSAAGGLAAGAIVVYVYSRTVGLPRAGDDIGNWSDPLGVAALFVEGAVVAVSGYALAAVMPVRRVSERARLSAHPA
ncbi:MAG TPA: hypothetical protein VIJ51_14435 [Solirubrobacteraceae bacterium]